MSIELDVWREACRHIEIEESISRMAPILARKLPLALVLVRRLDAQRSRLETVGVGGRAISSWKAATRTDLSSQELERVIEFFGEARVISGHADDDDAVRARVVPEGVATEVLIGPLSDDGGPQGVLVLVNDGARSFSPADITLTQTLLEPFTVALHNDQRFHELARLREAVEADNRALLTRLQRQNVLDTIVGEGSGLKTVLERVEQVAKTDVPVLILGETGSGKEVIARAIHERSRRATGPIVRVNCGAIPTELVDSELFGHERGSFTGASFTRKGWFERADGGTLFLDEVGELPLAAQVRLLRILQDGTLERVGGQRTITVDVRIVAATHRDLHSMVEDGRFREDLWYRISVFPLRLPSLRERVQDIPMLAAHFGARVGERLGSGPLVPSANDISMLVSYSWPGNVRELATVIERAAILGHGRRLDIAGALGAGIHIGGSPSKSTRPEQSSPTGLNDAMVKHIEQALTQTRGRIEGPYGAAALLGINPHTLRARMRKLGVDWSRFRS